MKPRMRIAACALLAAFCAQARAADDRCGAGKDLVVRALERISPTSDRGAFEDALQLLKHAVEECSELGDAWYYRSLVEQKLGHDALAKYAMDKARFNTSDALEQGLNPLVLATPAGRGIEVEEAPPQSPGTAAAAPVAGPVAQKWALVVGISRFTDAKIPRLNYTTADANSFAAELTDPQIGTPRTMDTAGGANYLVTYDTEVYNGGSFDEDAMFATAYPMVELADSVASRMKALRTAIILDTCYSGGSINAASSGADGALANKGPSDKMLERMSQGTGRIVLSASQVNEESLESPALRHGYFTYFLLQALKSGNGATPLSQVYATVAQQVSARVSADGSHQHPVMSRSSADADFALGVPAAEPAKVEP